jgi:hypothetical protein
MQLPKDPVNLYTKYQSDTSTHHRMLGKYTKHKLYTLILVLDTKHLTSKYNTLSLSNQL